VTTRRLDANLGAFAILLVLAGVAWWLLVSQSAGMAMAMEVSVPAYMATWLTMVAAMMLPATAPLALAYGQVARARGGGRLAGMPFTAGYLALWAFAGVVPLAVFVVSRGAVAGMAASPLGPLGLGAVLVVGGFYQLSPWKGACLRACRSPLGFALSHDFESGAKGGLRAGAVHGAFCLGCCWALMAVLAVVGLMSLASMAVLSVLILAEKNWRHGAGLARVAGVAMVAIGILVTL